MDYRALLEDSFTYTREGILNNRNRWLSLILGTILLCIPLSGYLVRVYRGIAPAPDVDTWGSLFIDGLKLILVCFIYAIPIILAFLMVFAFMLAGALSGSTDFADPHLRYGLESFLHLVFLIVGIFAPIASLRFARTGSVSEAFSFRAIWDTIGRIGWVSYLIALILINIVIGFPLWILVMAFILIGAIAALLGGLLAFLVVLALAVLLFLVLLPPILVFQARYLAMVYDSAAPAA